MQKKKKPFHPSYTQVIAFGFMGVIAITALLLLLPISSASGAWTNPVTALFTATSAVCVTGLVVVDTATHWSLFGWCVLLAAIQIGGLGIMTVATIVSMMLRRRIGLAERSILQESVSSLSIGGIVRLTRRISVGTLVFEGIGAVLLSLRFVPIFGVGRGIFYGLFHSVSAFCNAGFDLMGTYSGAYSSLSAFVGDPLINLVVCGLILLGGLGFFVWNDIYEHGPHFSKYQLHTKLVLGLTAFFVLVPTALFLIGERAHTFAGMPWDERLLAAFFSAVTPRTAGFNTVDTALLGDGSKLLTMLLMLIGGNPGSTAGGMKTTTLLMVILSARAMLLHRQDVNVLGRRIEADIIRRAACVATIYILLSVVPALAILFIQPGLALTDVLFEVVSAVDTVGMSTGITRSLSTVSRLIVVVLMFCGRIGSMTFALMFTERRKAAPVQFPVEKIMVG